MIGQTVSHYRIVQKIGEGGMGVVYSAEDLHLGRSVAIKFLSPSASSHHFRARFLREARSISQLNHPNIATLYDYGETDEAQPFFVMELVSGQSLNELLGNSELTIPRAVEIVELVADALSEAHARGIVHRDIKPSNIIINERGQVKVLDFGLAKQIGEELNTRSDPDAQTLLATRTQSNVVVGTPLYLSPEQAVSGVIDGRSDLFALGALLYEAIAGRPAFSGSSVMEIGAQVIHVDPAPPSSYNRAVPKELDRITLKALAKKPEDRYQSAEEMRADLELVRATLSGNVTRSRVPRLTSDSRVMSSSALVTISQSLRRPRLSIAAVLIATFGLLFIGWSATRILRPKPYKPSADALKFYQRGTEALRDGAYLQASKMLQSAVDTDPQFALAHARLAEAWMELDYADKAKDEVLKASSLVTDRSALPQADALFFKAVSAMAIRDFNGAVNAYQELAQLTPDDARVYVDLGRAFERNEQIDKAIATYLHAIDLDGQYATAYLRVGALYAIKLEGPSALRAFERSETLFRSLLNLQGVAEVAHLRGNLLRRLGRYEEASGQYKQAIETARATDNPSQEVNTLLDVSYLNYLEGKVEQSRQVASDAINFAQQQGLEIIAIDGMINLSLGLMARGDYAEAEKLLKEAGDFARRNKAPLREALASLNLGSLYIQTLRTDEGLVYVNRALVVFRQGGYRRHLLNCLGYLARGYRRKGDFSGALAAIEEKRKVAEEAGDELQIASSLAEMASVWMERENFPKALSLYEESSRIYETIGGAMYIAYNLENRGSLNWKLGQYQEAQRLLQQSADLAGRPGNDFKQLTAAVDLSYAQMALSQRNFGDARKFAAQALDVAKTDYPDITVSAKSVMGLAAAASGSYREAKAICEEAVHLASQAGDESLQSRTKLAYARVLLESGDMDGALSQSAEVIQRFSNAGQLESRWRAELLNAIAANKKQQGQGQSRALAAANSLNSLKESWGAAGFDSYTSRPDIKVLQQQLAELTSAGQ